MMWCFYLWTVLSIIAINLIHSRRNAPPRIKFKQGIIEGIKISNVRVFYGIPYAQPPIGSLRFRSPKVHQGWNGTYQAINPKPSCPQLPINANNYDEDCLYLDIWAPEFNSTRNFPVVVYFGGVEFGRDNKLDFNGEGLASKDMIIVRVNYRLNIFGFLCLGDSELRGNMGLLDQYYAMLWVKQNIAYLGGDSANISLFGYFSGAVSIAIHIISPRTTGLFQKAILSSGTSLWNDDNETIQNSRRIISILKCDSKTISCLEKKSVTDLLQALQTLSQSVNRTDILSPVVDAFLQDENRYLPMSPITVFQEGSQLQIPLLIGIGWPVKNREKDEWVNLLSQGYSFLQNHVEGVAIPNLIRLHKLNQRSENIISELIKWEYSLFVDDDARFLVDQLNRMEYESTIEAPMFQQISHILQKSHQPNYVYSAQNIEFSTEISEKYITMDMVLLMGPIFARRISRRPFGFTMSKLSSQIQEYFTNFITFGNPNLHGQKVWRQYHRHDPYVEILSEVPNYEYRKQQIKRVNFWNNLLQKISNNRQNYIQPSISVQLSKIDAASRFRNIILGTLLVILLISLILCLILLKKKNENSKIL